jgi:hypothetical protein
LFFWFSFFEFCKIKIHFKSFNKLLSHVSVLAENKKRRKEEY